MFLYAKTGDYSRNMSTDAYLNLFGRLPASPIVPVKRQWHSTEAAV